MDREKSDVYGQKLKLGFSRKMLIFQQDAHNIIGVEINAEGVAGLSHQLVANFDSEIHDFGVLGRRQNYIVVISKNGGRLVIFHYKKRGSQSTRVKEQIITINSDQESLINLTVCPKNRFVSLVGYQLKMFLTQSNVLVLEFNGEKLAPRKSVVAKQPKEVLGMPYSPVFVGYFGQNLLLAALSQDSALTCLRTFSFDVNTGTFKELMALRTQLFEESFKQAKKIILLSRGRLLILADDGSVLEVDYLRREMEKALGVSGIDNIPVKDETIVDG